MNSLPRRRRRRRTARLGTLLALASTASAVSLNDLQPVQDGVLPMACSLVYHTAIQGCTAADFAKGGSCSLSCIAGIKQIEDSIDDQCQNVKARTDSLELLSDAQRGSLILGLCVGNDFTLASTTSTSSIKQTLTTPSTIPLTTPLITTSHTIGSFSTIPLATTTPIRTTTAQTTPIQSTASKTTFTFVPPSSSSTSLLTSQLSTTILSTTSPQSAVSQSSSTSTTAAVSSLSTSPSQTGNGKGGGSPFDTTSGSSTPSMPWSMCLAVGLLVVVNLHLQ